ncbi:hypothetical protein A2239_01620 [Candidatus Uhrbacteria bacterium RIFOXYA2_FULL_40_9]|nr:MAG: hypothetical protein A2239_01620 [Candidatus Uhrbacteria bacterium RIFOXYA2_FULL_40_9]
MRLPVSTKIILLFTLISLVTATVLTLFSDYSSQQAFLDWNQDHLDSIVLLKEQEINILFEKQAEIFQMIAENEEMRIAELFPYFGQEEEEQFLKEKTVVNALSSYTQSNFGFFELFLLDVETGKILLSTNESEVGKYRADKEFYRKGLEGLFISQFYYSFPLQNTAISFSIPIHDLQQQTIGVLVGRVDLQEIFEVMNEPAGLGQTGETYLVNVYNYLIASSKKETGNTVLITQPVYTEASKSCLQGKSGSGVYQNFEGKTVVGVYHWIPERNVCILAEMNEQEVLATVLYQRWMAFVIGGSIALLMILLGFYFSAKLTKPLEILSKGAEIIGKGNLKHTIAITSQDEFGELSREFNTMAGNLAASRKQIEKDLEKKQLTEKSLRSFQVELEDRVEKRTEELSKANEKLEELDKMKDNFLNIVTHELRNPLVPIKLQLELLIDGDFGKLSKKQLDSLRMILRNEERLDTLTADMLDMTRMKTGKFKLFPTSVSLTSLVKNAVDEFTVLAALRSITLTADTQQLPMISADQIRITQVLSNLLTNAIKFTSEQGTIQIKAFEEKDNCVVQVTDSGLGISKENIEKLFEAFYQIETRVQRKTEGTGLGLAICKGIIEAHGGKIWAESEGEGKGSTFSFTLPKKMIIL